MEEIKTQPRYKGATVRAILIGLALVAFNTYWVTITEMKYRAEATALPIFIYPIFLLFWLVVFNNGILRFWPRFQFSAGELLTVYSMIVISTSIASYGMLQDLFAIALHPYQFATQENEWKELFFHYIPPWFTASAPEVVLTGYYEGDSSFYEPKHFKAWMRPVIVWTVFTLILLFMLHCINTLVRRQWVHTERLAFPIIQLPVAMTQSSHFLRNGLLWVGFSIPFVLDLMNGLHVLFPSVPYLHLKLHFIGRQLTEKPWDAMSNTMISFYPFMIGLGFFLPLDLSFTCWFFFLIRQFSRVLSSYLGLDTLPGFPYFYEQSAGAWICMCFIAIWVTRRHLVFAFRTAFSEKSSVDADEPMRYRTALFGLVGGFLFMFIFSYQAGMSIIAIPVFFGLYFAIAIAVTRLRAEFGAPHGIFNHPADMMVTALGTLTWGGGSLTVMSFYQLPVEQTALVLVDVWNVHFIESWIERAKDVTLNAIVPVLNAARETGLTIVHAPCPEVAGQFPQLNRHTPPEAQPTPDWPPPEFQSRTGEYAAYRGPRSQPPSIGIHWDHLSDKLGMSPAIEVQDDDFVIAAGEQLHQLSKERGILHLIYVGFATNWCVVGRDYGIRAMTRRGYNIILLRDATTGVEFPDTLDQLFTTEITIREVEQQCGFSASNEDFFAACSAV